MASSLIHIFLSLLLLQDACSFSISKCQKTTYLEGTSTRYDLTCDNVSSLDFDALEKQLSNYYIGKLKYNGNINTIQAHSFNRTNFVTRLYLLNVGITIIEPQAFSNLNLLEILDLDSNQLTNLDKDAFYGLPNLQTLDLRRNKLTGSLDGVFKNLAKLDTLYLQNNNISNLENAFGGLTKLTTLYLSYNNIKNIPEHCFKDLKVLNRLQLENNSIETVDKTAFENLVNLRYLNLKNNKLKTLSIGTFHDLKNLMQLDLSSNLLNEESLQYASGLSNLTLLNISRNAFTKFDHLIYFPLTKLEQLYLDHNRIEYLEYQDMLQHIPKLKVLSVGANKLSCDVLLTLAKYITANNVNLKLDTIMKVKFDTNIHSIGCSFSTTPKIETTTEPITEAVTQKTTSTKIIETTIFKNDMVTITPISENVSEFFVSEETESESVTQKSTSTKIEKVESAKIDQKPEQNCQILNNHHTLLIVILILLFLILIVALGFFAWKFNDQKKKSCVNVRYIEDKVDLI